MSSYNTINFQEQGGEVSNIGGELNVTGEINVSGEINISGTIVLPENSIGTDEIQNQAITYGKANIFITDELIGTGSEESIPHTLGRVPHVVFVSPVDLSTIGTIGDFKVTQGSHTTTELKLQVTNGKGFQVLAWG